MKIERSSGKESVNDSARQKTARKELSTKPAASGPITDLLAISAAVLEATALRRDRRLPLLKVQVGLGSYSQPAKDIAKHLIQGAIQCRALTRHA